MNCYCECDECNDGDHCGTICCDYDNDAALLMEREPGCVLGAMCCMTGTHFADECFTAEDMEEWMREGKVRPE